MEAIIRKSHARRPVWRISVSDFVTVLGVITESLLWHHDSYLMSSLLPVSEGWCSGSPSSSRRPPWCPASESCRLVPPTFPVSSRHSGICRGSAETTGESLSQDAAAETSPGRGIPASRDWRDNVQQCPEFPNKRLVLLNPSSACMYSDLTKVQSVLSTALCISSSHRASRQSWTSWRSSGRTSWCDPSLWQFTIGRHKTCWRCSLRVWIIHLLSPGNPSWGCGASVRLLSHRAHHPPQLEDSLGGVQSCDWSGSATNQRNQVGRKFEFCLVRTVVTKSN